MNKNDYRGNWFETLEFLSSTNDVYNLLMGKDMYPDFQGISHTGDFVVINTARLTDAIKLADVLEDSTEWPFPGNKFKTPGYVLMQTEKLTPYLDAAVNMKPAEDENQRIFIELEFIKPEKKKITLKEDNSYLESVTDEREMALIESWQLFASATNKTTALAKAKLGQAFLQEQGEDFLNQKQEDINRESLIRWHTGHHITASVFCWNELYEEAFAEEQWFLQPPQLWEHLHDTICYYLELLMVKNQQLHLQEIFADMELRAFFKIHYEVYVSLFIDDTFPLSSTLKAVPVFNRVTHAKKLYN